MGMFHCLYVRAAQIKHFSLMPEAATYGLLQASSLKLQEWGWTGNGAYKSLAHGELRNVIVILIHVGCCAAHHTLIKAIAVVPHISSHLHACNVSDILHFCLHSALI